MDLAHEDWSLRTDEAMQEFLTSRNESVLVLFYDEDKLVAVCGFPSFELPDLMYFVKCSDADVTLENFHRLIAFGSVKNLPEAALLTLLEQIYAPVYFNIKDWPDRVGDSSVANNVVAESSAVQGGWSVCDSDPSYSLAFDSKSCGQK
ncbi:unnamed protein product [Bemisia tabaci]|uniref:Uncharacterized protein n=1 Tax=Bemisia tabaci TaxID=7038 RepID=A0A9P0AMI5_BEMTA|nr:unnamed protein product [Bemisia tabaci]